MFVFRLSDLILLTAMVAVIFALRQLVDSGTVLLLGFLPGAVFAMRSTVRSENPDLFLRMFSRGRTAAAGGCASAILLALLFFGAVEGESVRRQPITTALAINLVFGIAGSMGGFVVGVLYSLGEESPLRFQRGRLKDRSPGSYESTNHDHTRGAQEQGTSATGGPPGTRDTPGGVERDN